MKIIAGLAVLFILSCQSRRTEAIEEISITMKKENELVSYQSHEIEKVGGCEYIHFYPRRGVITTVHKGDCINPFHKTIN